MYIGATDSRQENKWTWTDGTPWKYQNWYRGEPNNAGRGEDCGVLYNGVPGQWNDVRCNTAWAGSGFICSYKLEGTRNFNQRKIKARYFFQIKTIRLSLMRNINIIQFIGVSIGTFLRHTFASYCGNPGVNQGFSV